MIIDKLEKKVYDLLAEKPFLRKGAKRIYHLGMYTISKKIKFEGDLKRVSPSDDYEYFFGYYDKSPWDKTNRYMLSLRVKNSYKSVAPTDVAEIIIIDTKNNNSFRKIAETRAWNIQQGCMLQWLGPKFTNEILYNDYRDGSYCSVILNIDNGKERVLKMPVYSVSEKGDFALTLDFTRLHVMRPGYGYSNTESKDSSKNIPDQTCIWKINLKTGEIKPILNYMDFFDFETRKEMKNAKHKINHIMINPSGTRFMVLHRWYVDNLKFSRLVTADMDGKNLYNLSDDDFVSHCTWKSDEEILAYLNKDEIGHGYYLMKDQTNKWNHVLKDLTTDGHPSYSPDNTMIVTDTYPNRQRLSSLYLISDEKVQQIARVFSPFRYDNDVRCDLHPRWDRESKNICIDAVFEGKRGLYVINLKGVYDNE